MAWPLPAPSLVCCSMPPTASGRGPPSACPPTSSRRLGGRWKSRSCSDCSTPLRATRKQRMASPNFVPTDPVDRPRSYASPDHVPERWLADRPADLSGRQPVGDGLGFQGPDQGYALVLAERFRDRLHLQPQEKFEDAV